MTVISNANNNLFGRGYSVKDDLRFISEVRHRGCINENNNPFQPIKARKEYSSAVKEISKYKYIDGNTEDLLSTNAKELLNEARNDSSLRDELNLVYVNNDKAFYKSDYYIEKYGFKGFKSKDQIKKEALKAFHNEVNVSLAAKHTNTPAGFKLNLDALKSERLNKRKVSAFLGKLKYDIEKLGIKTEEDYNGCLVDFPIRVKGGTSNLFFGKGDHSSTINNQINKFIKAGVLSQTGYTDLYRTEKDNLFGNIKKYTVDLNNLKAVFKYYEDKDIKPMDCSVFTVRAKNTLTEETLKKYSEAKSSFDKSLKLDRVYDAVKISSRIRIKNYPELNFSKEEFEEFVLFCFEEKYSEYKTAKKNIQDINKSYDKFDNGDLLKLRLKPTITWNKKGDTITKIGYRAINDASSSRTHIRDNEEVVEGDLSYRKELTKYFGMNLSYDVSASVPRLTKALNEGKYSFDVDIYRSIHDEDKKICTSTGTAPICSFYDKEGIKAFFMRGYFNKSAKQAISSMSYGSEFAYEILSDRYNLSRKSLKSFYTKAFDAYMTAIRNVIGAPIGSEIFFHETNIYTAVTKRLIRKGYTVFLCYDCWYAKAPNDNIDNEDFKALIEKLIIEEFNKYYRRLHNISIEDTKNVKLKKTNKKDESGLEIVKIKDKKYIKRHETRNIAVLVDNQGALFIYNKRKKVLKAIKITSRLTVNSKNPISELVFKGLKDKVFISKDGKQLKIVTKASKDKEDADTITIYDITQH